MLTHLFAILGLAGLCAGWVLFQQWLKRLDPEVAEREDACSGCGHCRRKPPAGKDAQ